MTDKKREPHPTDELFKQIKKEFKKRTTELQGLDEFFKRKPFIKEFEQEFKTIDTFKEAIKTNQSDSQNRLIKVTHTVMNEGKLKNLGKEFKKIFDELKDEYLKKQNKDLKSIRYTYKDDQKDVTVIIGHPLLTLEEKTSFKKTIYTLIGKKLLCNDQPITEFEAKQFEKKLKTFEQKVKSDKVTIDPIFY